MADIEAPPLSRKMHDLTGHVALVTGVGCIGEGWGNGMAIATLLARQGASIVGCDLSLEAGENTRQRILAENPNADVTIMSADAASAASMEVFVNTCMKIHGRVDILVNNVGYAEVGDAASMSEQTWDRQIGINLKSVYLTSHLVLPIMALQVTGGAIINISSISGLRHLATPAIGYAAAKAAILAFTRSTAITYARSGVRMNTVIPGMMDTPLLRQFAHDYESLRKTRNGQCPTGKMGSAWDVANAVLFLASKEAQYITGTDILVDGGLAQTIGHFI